MDSNTRYRRSAKGKKAAKKANGRQQLKPGVVAANKLSSKKYQSSLKIIKCSYSPGNTQNYESFIWLAAEVGVSTSELARQAIELFLITHLDSIEGLKK
jgi:hypothetical protein